MSLFACIDLIDEQVEKLQSGKLTVLQSTIHFISYSSKNKHNESSLADQSFLKILKENIIKHIVEDNYENLSKDIELINRYLVEEKYSLSRDCLKYIIDDFSAIDTQLKKTKDKSDGVQHSPPKVNEGYHQPHSQSMEYIKFQSPKYRIAEINQGKLHKLGISRGECLGITYSMANPKLSPYNNPGLKIDLNQEIHNYQRFQADREKDQGTIKYSRLTREHFCADKEKQAKEILEFAEHYKGKELYLARRCSVGGHASYLSFRENGDIRYMDPNHGAYLFKNRQDFLDFYIAAAKEEKSAGADFRFYTLSQLKYDEKNDFQETKNQQGTLRTLLTGAKYDDNTLLSNNVTSGFYATVGTGVGAGIGALIGSVVPVIGTLVGAVIGAGIGCFFGAGLAKIAMYKGHFGLLGGFHLIQDTWQNVKENISDFISPTPKKDFKLNNPKIITIKDSDSCSTSSILSLLHVSAPLLSSVEVQKPKSTLDDTDQIKHAKHVIPTEKVESTNSTSVEPSTGNDASVSFRSQPT